MRVSVDLRVQPRTNPAGRAGSVRASAVAVIVDVLRSTTTLTVALDHGAARVVPVATPAEGFALRTRAPNALLCGERVGRRIEGFDLGNSPYEYEAARVEGRDLIFASTNGSRALLAAASARARILAAFVNLAAVVERLGGEREVAILCAGTSGEFALEDAACAGLLVRRLCARGARPANAAAALAGTLAPEDAGEVRSIVHGCSHGRYLRSLGPEFVRDVERCAQLDTLGRAFAV